MVLDAVVASTIPELVVGTVEVESGEESQP